MPAQNLEVMEVKVFARNETGWAQVRAHPRRRVRRRAAGGPVNGRKPKQHHVIKKGLHGSNKQKTPLLCDTTNNIGQYQTF